MTPVGCFTSCIYTTLTAVLRSWWPNTLQNRLRMPKGQKSSASSGTRKKHARKSAGAEQQLPLPKEKKPKDKSKGKNKEPRAKVYIPPTKPVAVRPDPLDSLGIAKRLPPELVIVLRRLGKKDTVTKRKALEDLLSDWIVKASVGEDYALEDALVLSMPVWVSCHLFHDIPPFNKAIASSPPLTIATSFTKDTSSVI